MSAIIHPVSELFEVASCTHPGAVREANEDSCATFVADDCAGIVVADGVSSFNGGDTASRMAVEVTLEAFLGADKSLRLGKRLHRAVQRANVAVHDRALGDPVLCSMATTLTAVVLAGDELFAAHVGDCRLYLHREDRLQQLTRDHTVAAERMRLGVLSKARAREHKDRSTLTRGLGRELIARVDQLSARVAARDVLMICSDGIHGLLDDTEIARLCLGSNAETVCQDLVDAANRRGAPDNVTAAVARVTAALPSRPARSGIFGALARIVGRQNG